MGKQTKAEFLRTASAGLPEEEAELLGALHRFTGERLEAAERAKYDVEQTLEREADAAPEVHAFLSECWEVLDGLAREVNLCMHHLFPAAGLYPPMEMTRQCTFYMVRKKLHEDPQTADHPVSLLLWERTRESPAPAYQRLSFLYNLSLFFPVPVEQGRLPGTSDLPELPRRLIKSAEVERCDATDGMEEIVRWLNDLAAQCYQRLGRALARKNDQEQDEPRRHRGHGERQEAEPELSENRPGPAEKPGGKSLLHEDVTAKIIGAAIEVHKTLGPGLLESVYEECLCHELHLRGVEYRRQVELPVRYKGVRLDGGCRVDLLVSDAVIVELKTVVDILPVYEAQLLTYLRLSGKRAGLLINFNVPVLRDGIVRRVL